MTTTSSQKTAHVSSASPFREGALLCVVRPGGIRCEPDIFKREWARFRAFSIQMLPSDIKKAIHLRKGSVVLCVENSLNENLGIRVMRFLYQEKLYTYIGYYLPEEVFRPVIEDEAFTPVSTEEEDSDF